MAIQDIYSDILSGIICLAISRSGPGPLHKRERDTERERRKKEEGRRKKEEGRRKKEEGRRKKEEGRRKKEEGRRKKEEGRRRGRGEGSHTHTHPAPRNSSPERPWSRRAPRCTSAKGVGGGWKEEERKEGREGGGRRERERVAPLLKSRDPHLAGGIYIWSIFAEVHAGFRNKCKRG